MKRFRYLLVSVLGLALVGSVATAAVMSNKNSYNVMAENATISATPAENTTGQREAIKINVTAPYNWDAWPGFLRFHVYDVKTVFDGPNDAISSTNSSKYFYDENSSGVYNVLNNTGADLYDNIVPVFDERGVQKPNESTLIKSGYYNEPSVTYEFPWYVTELKIDLIFDYRSWDQNRIYQPNEPTTLTPGLWTFNEIANQVASGSSAPFRCSFDWGVERTSNYYVNVNEQYATFLESYFSVIHRDEDERLNFCSDMSNQMTTNLANLLSQYTQLDSNVKAEVDRVLDYKDETKQPGDPTYYNTIYGVMEYLKTYVPYRQARMDQAGTALFFDGSSDNSLLIAGVASLGLLSVVGVAYFINQKKKRA